MTKDGMYYLRTKAVTDAVNYGEKEQAEEPLTQVAEGIPV
jgi:hypothetical protein